MAATKRPIPVAEKEMVKEKEKRKGKEKKGQVKGKEKEKWTVYSLIAVVGGLTQAESVALPTMVSSGPPSIDLSTAPPSLEDVTGMCDGVEDDRALADVLADLAAHIPACGTPIASACGRVAVRVPQLRVWQALGARAELDGVSNKGAP